MRGVQLQEIKGLSLSGGTRALKGYRKVTAYVKTRKRKTTKKKASKRKSRSSGYAGIFS